MPVALLDNCRPTLRTRSPAVRIVASTANGEPYERLDPCRMSLAGDSGMPRVEISTVSFCTNHECDIEKSVLSRRRHRLALVVQDLAIIGDACRSQRSGLEVRTLTCSAFLHTMGPFIYPFSPGRERRISPTAAITMLLKQHAKNARSPVQLEVVTLRFNVT
jgi:hypothetical protein